MLSEQEMRPPILLDGCCWSHGPGLQSCLLLSPVLVQPLPLPLPGSSEGQAHLAGNEKQRVPAVHPPAPAHSPRPLRCKASCALPVLAGAQPVARGHTGTAEPSQQLPFKAHRVSQGLPAWRGNHGHSTETPTASRAWKGSPPARHRDPQHRPSSTGAERRAPGLSLPSRRHSSCCHHFCLLERGGRRLAEPGRARRPGGRGSAAWCRVPARRDPRARVVAFVFSPAITGATRGSSGATLPALSCPTPVALGQGHDPCPNVTPSPWGPAGLPGRGGLWPGGAVDPAWCSVEEWAARLPPSNFSPMLPGSCAAGPPARQLQARILTRMKSRRLALCPPTAADTAPAPAAAETTPDP